MCHRQPKLIQYLQVNHGVCSIPSCDDNDDDMWNCNIYHEYWSLTGSIFYCFTLVTTIGYGSFSPGTDGGKIFTLFYSFLGIILFGFGLAELLQLPEAVHGYSKDECVKRCAGVKLRFEEKREINAAKNEELVLEMDLEKRIEENEKKPTSHKTRAPQ